jgi:hypothetical protein
LSCFSSFYIPFLLCFFPISSLFFFLLKYSSQHNCGFRA